ncbi:hypothetical protein VPH35_118886 [Triticum aestivum]
MYQRRATCFLVLAIVLLLPPLPASYPCVAAAHGPLHHAPGGDAGACGQTDGLHRQGGKVSGMGAARRLGRRIPLKDPPSPIPNENSGVVIPLPPPPPLPIN